MVFDENLPLLLRHHLGEELPGQPARRAYSHPQSYGRHCGPAPSFARQAAILVFVYWDGQQWLLPLTRRSAKGIHASQICFAGGGLEGNEHARDAALRECHEEMGWAPPARDILGQLSPIFVYASNNLVSCFVAATLEKPTWNPDPREVAQILEVPLRHLYEDDMVHATELDRFGLSSTAPCFRWKSYDIWGATSMVISELKAVMKTAEV